MASEIVKMQKTIKESEEKMSNNQTEVLEETNKLKTAVTSILKVKENVNTTRKKFQKDMKGSKVEIKTE